MDYIMQACSFMHHLNDCFVLMSMQVTFDFTIDLSRLSRPGIVEAYPSTGKVAAGEKARVKLKVQQL